ncbi:MAG: hypothetical protein QOF51_3560 [Chloroflexota bacterium]|jgi:hypothetical protein|nr:hypothetical protein [Chloroflexota bacterium]
MTQRGRDTTLAALLDLIRKSQAIDDLTKRQWLSAAPHLTLRDRARLQEILESELHARAASATPRPTS